MVTNLRAAGVELQFSRNDVQGKRMISVLPMLHRSEKIVSDRQ